MTAAIKLAALLCIGACFAGTARAADAGRVVRSATSNDIWALSGNGDTVWMVTAGGVNFAIDTSADSLAWWGYKTDRGPQAVHFGAGRAMICLGTPYDTTPNDLWWYDHRSGKDTTAAIPFNRAELSRYASNQQRPVSFYCRDLVRDNAFYWLAFRDGGLVRWDHTAKNARVFSVGDPISVKSDSFPIAGDVTFADTGKRVISIDAANAGTDTQQIYIATPRAIWRFTPADSTWDTLTKRLDDSSITVQLFLDVTVNNRIQPAGIFAFIQTSADSLMLYKYEPSGVAHWVRVVADTSRPYAPSSLTFGRDGRMYAGGDRRSVFRFTDQNGTGHLPQPPADGGSASALDKRLERATDVNLGDRIIQDVLCTVRFSATDTVQRLWIATADGLYYSRNEAVEDTTAIAFRYYRRAPRVTEGLKNTYVFPGILTNQTAYLKSGEWQKTPHAVFAYNLTANAKVTIRIYDFNNDLVKTIIENQPRIAGANRQLGRSTEPSSDFWDGTDRFGRIVSPGVYYYRISTDKGDRAMGRIVVALQRK